MKRFVLKKYTPIREINSAQLVEDNFNGAIEPCTILRTEKDADIGDKFTVYLLKSDYPENNLHYDPITNTNYYDVVIEQD